MAGNDPAEPGMAGQPPGPGVRWREVEDGLLSGPGEASRTG